MGVALRAGSPGTCTGHRIRGTEQPCAWHRKPHPLSHLRDRQAPLCCSPRPGHHHLACLWVRVAEGGPESEQPRIDVPWECLPHTQRCCACVRVGSACAKDHGATYQGAPRGCGAPPGGKGASATMSRATVARFAPSRSRYWCTRTPPTRTGSACAVCREGELVQWRPQSRVPPVRETNIAPSPSRRAPG